MKLAAKLISLEQKTTYLLKLLNAGIVTIADDNPIKVVHYCFSMIIHHISGVFYQFAGFCNIHLVIIVLL